MKKIMLAVTLLCTLNAFSVEYNARSSQAVSRAFADSLKMVVVEGQNLPINKTITIRGKSEKNLPCQVNVWINPSMIQVSLIEVKNESDLEINGIPATRHAQFRWQAFNPKYKKQKLHEFNHSSESVIIDYEYRESSSVMGGAGYARIEIDYDEKNGIQGIFAKEYRGLLWQDKEYLLRCSGPWTKNRH